MIEISDTNFRCNACGSNWKGDVKYISVILDGTTQRLNFRLCSKCRKQLKKML